MPTSDALRFRSNSACQSCALWESAHSVCIPTHLFPVEHIAHELPHNQAVLIVGQSPGYEEDKANRNFIGESGRQLDIYYVHGPELHHFADIYVSNVSRCHPIGDSKATKGQRRACTALHLQPDIQLLSRQYRRVAILAVGSESLATLAPMGGPKGTRERRLAGHWGSQGESLVGYSNVFLFATYHPAATLPARSGHRGRNPALLQPVETHVLALREWLETGHIAREDPPTPIIAPDVTGQATSNWEGRLVFDLETYGSLIDATDQTTFHPQKMEIIDGVSPKDQIVCASICWRRGVHQSIHTGYFNWFYSSHRAKFAQWLKAAKVIGGQNLQFDIKLVRAYCRHLREAPWIPVWKPLQELLVETFVYDDLQPERSLDAVSWLYRLAGYPTGKKPVHIFKGPDDPECIKYACTDAFNTYRGLEVSRDWQQEAFASHPIAKSKVTERRHRWSSNEVWSAILQEETGATFNLLALQKLHSEIQTRFDSLAVEALDRFNLVLSGPGSGKALVALVTQASNLVPDLELSRTTTTHDLSADADNRRLILGALPGDSPEAQQLNLVNESAGLKKLITSYTRTLLRGKQTGPFYDYKVVPTKSPKAKNPTRRLRVPGSEHYKYDRRPACLPFKELSNATLENSARIHSPSGVQNSSPDRPPRDTRQTFGEGHDRIRPLCHNIEDTKAGTLRQSRRLGIVYPSYFITPRAEEKGRSGGAAGTSRWSAKDPPIQTLPEVVRDTMCSRYSGGVLAATDLSQIEWRMNMFESGDSRGLQEIADGTDIHSESASYLLGFDITSTKAIYHWLQTGGMRLIERCPSYKMRALFRDDIPGDEDCPKVAAWLRQEVGKSPNFAELNGCSDEGVQAIPRVKAGIDIPIERCHSYIQDRETRYPERHAFRRQLLDQVFRDGAYHVPILGQSRSFGNGSREDIEHTYREKILGAPHQIQSFNLLLCAVVRTQSLFLKHRLRAVVVCQIHDSIVHDSAPADSARAQEIVENSLEDNWYRRALEDLHGRGFPVEYETKPIGVSTPEE